MECFLPKKERVGLKAVWPIEKKLLLPGLIALGLILMTPLGSFCFQEGTLLPWAASENGICAQWPIRGLGSMVQLLGTLMVPLLDGVIYRASLSRKELNLDG